MAAPAAEGPRIRVAALALLDGKVLLVRHRAGDATYYLLPGGGVDYRETLGDALVREVREETGLDVSLGEPVLLSDTIDPRGSRHVVNVTFRVNVLGGELRPSLDSRVEGTELVDPDRLAALDLRPPMAEAIVGVLDAGAGGPAHYLGPLFTDGR